MFQVELWVGPRDARWQTITFNREEDAREFVSMCQHNGFDARPAGDESYRHDFGPVMC